MVRWEQVVVESKSMRMVRNLLAYWATFLMIVFVYYDIDGHGSEHNIVQKIIMMIFPLLTSSYFWNYKVYDFLGAATYYSNESSYQKAYLNFTRLFIGVLIFFDIGMIYGIGFKLGLWGIKF